MRRFTGLLAFVAILLMALAPARADQTYTAQAPFQTTETMWNGASGMRQTIPLWTNVNETFDKQEGTDITLLGHFSVGASGTIAADGGLRFSQYANGGTVSVAYPLTLNLTYPDPATLSPGQTFTLSSSWARGVPGADPYMSTNSPSLGLAAAAGLNVSQARLKFSARAFGAWIFNDNIFNIQNQQFNAPLFDTGGGTGTTHIGRAVTVQAKKTMLDTSGSSSSDNSIQSSANSDFVSVSGNITNVLVSLFPDLTGFGSNSINLHYVSGSYDFLSLVGTLDINALQAFRFDPHPKVQLNLSTGQTVNFNAGDFVQLTMPSDGSTLRITPVMTLDSAFRNRTIIRLGGGSSGLSFIPFSIHARLHTSADTESLDYSLPTVDLLSVGASQDFTTYDQTFPLGAFCPRTLPDFVIKPTLPPPPPTPTLTPADDSYIGFADSISGTPVYRVLTSYTGIPVPGVLANDQSSGDFEAVPQDWHDAQHPDTHYFKLDAFGRVDFAIPQSQVPQDSQFQFPYQITDGQGHFATANIYITVGPNGGG